MSSEFKLILRYRPYFKLKPLAWCPATQCFSIALSANNKTSMGSNSYSGQLTTRFRGTILDVFFSGLTTSKRAICQSMRSKNKNMTCCAYLLAMITVIKPYAAQMTSWLQNYFSWSYPDSKICANLQ